MLDGPETSRYPLKRASMRPGHYCPGNYSRRVYKATCLFHASMRPGHYCPGNIMAVLTMCEKETASMRPGHYCPGNSLLRSPCEGWLISTRCERWTLLSPSVPEPLLKDPHRVWVSPYHTREKRDARAVHHFKGTKALAGSSAHANLHNCRPSGRYFITLAQTLDVGINSIGEA